MHVVHELRQSAVLAGSQVCCIGILIDAMVPEVLLSAFVSERLS